MASSLSNLVDNLAEGINKIKWKDCDCFLEYKSVKDNLIKYKRLFCNNDYSNKLDDPVKCLSAPGLAWQAAFKKSEVKLELLTNSNMLLKV